MVRIAMVAKSTETGGGSPPVIFADNRRRAGGAPPVQETVRHLRTGGGHRLLILSITDGYQAVNRLIKETLRKRLAAIEGEA
jgi:hypothetical protein